MDDSLKSYRQELQLFQSARLRREFADLAAQRQYAQLGEFFFTEMYGTNDFSARDDATRKLQHYIFLAPGVELSDITQAVELIDITRWLDETMAKRMLTIGADIPFNDVQYEAAYRVVGTYEQRERQIELACATLTNIRRITKVPFVGMALRNLRSVAVMTGIAELHDFLLKGHDAFERVRDARYFVETIRSRETERLNRIFGQT